jgi:hypothetical protein
MGNNLDPLQKGNFILLLFQSKLIQGKEGRNIKEKKENEKRHLFSFLKYEISSTLNNCFLRDDTTYNELKMNKRQTILQAKS